MTNLKLNPVEDPTYLPDLQDVAIPSMVLREPSSGEQQSSIGVSNFARDMRNRTFAFSLEVVDIMNTAPDSPSLRVIRNQLLRSSTSIMSNYRAVCRARSDAEFYSKISIVVEEADETVGWLGLIFKSQTIKMDKSKIELLMNEAIELTKIFAKSRSTVKGRIKAAKLARPKKS